MARFLPLAILLMLPGSALACWAAIDPHGFARGCPLIVTATIESVVQAKPGGEREDDIANLRIDAVHRNELTDVGLQKGTLLAVRMISKNNRLRSSTDLNHPVGTQAVWLIVLTSTGQYRIDVHPVQKQPVRPAPNFGIEQRVLVKGGDNAVNPAGSKTVAQWIAWRKAEEARRAKDIADHNAREKAIRDLAKAFADAGTLEDALWQRYLDSDTEVRRDMFQLRKEEQPMTGPRLAEAVQGALTREKDDNIRSHAVNALAYSQQPGTKGVEALLAGLRDRSASVRLFACQAVKFRGFAQLAGEVRMLEFDTDSQVRDMARETLESWRQK